MFYRLCHLDLTQWLLNGTRFLRESNDENGEVKNALHNAKPAQEDEAKKPSAKE